MGGRGDHHRRFPFWMAPEQAKPGATLTPATDVWALEYRVPVAVGRLVLAHRGWDERVDRRGAHWILVEPMEPASVRAALSLRALPTGFDAWFAQVELTPLRFADARAISLGARC